jgi:hypothetical protein
MKKEKKKKKNLDFPSHERSSSKIKPKEKVRNVRGLYFTQISLGFGLVQSTYKKKKNLQIYS